MNKTDDPGAATPLLAPIDRIAIAVATAGGAGFAPKAPGTAGSLVGVGIYLAVALNGWDSLYLPMLVLILALGVWSASKVEAVYGHDASKIVIDEVAGQMITLGFVVRIGVSATVTASIFGFLLFRLFDILKPFPLRSAEKLPGGLGVMADDVGAGVYGLLFLLLSESLIARMA